MPSRLSPSSLQGVSRHAHLPRDLLQRGCVRRQQLGYHLVLECLSVSSHIVFAIVTRQSISAIHELLQASQERDLSAQALVKVSEGQTTLSEIARVIGYA